MDRPWSRMFDIAGRDWSRGYEIVGKSRGGDREGVSELGEIGVASEVELFYNLRIMVKYSSYYHIDAHSHPRCLEALLRRSIQGHVT